MKKHDIQCVEEMPSKDGAWSYIRDFGSDWHPDIVKNQTHINTNGATVRKFTSTDGGLYQEQISYFSDTDQVLRYAMTAGVKGIQRYRAEVTTNANAVSWSASFNAPENLGKAVSDGTTTIFNNGLEWLVENSRKNQPREPATCSTSKNTKLKRVNIEGPPQLSFLTSDNPSSSCWTLVLLLHGIGGNATNWQSQLEMLADTHHIAALDLRGYGQSQLGHQQTHIDDHCNDILNVMHHFGARKLVLVGLSMGSWIATSFAMRHPQLLSGLVLAGGCTGMSEADVHERAQFLESRSVPLSQGKRPAEFADAVVDLISGPNASAEHKSLLHDSMSAISTETYLDALNCFCNPVEKFDFSRIQCPVVLLTGEFDTLATPAQIRRVSFSLYDAIDSTDRIPDIRFEIIEDAGHLCNVEQSDTFNKHLRDFLTRVSGTTKQSIPTRESKRQLKSRLILDAALKEFSAQGFDGVSMSAIAKRAGVSKPTLYQYFGDKDGLFAQVLNEGCEHIITPLSAPDGSLVDRLWDFSWTYAHFVLRPDMLSLARLVLGEASRRPDVAGVYHASGPGKAFKGIVEFIRECVEADQLEVDDLEYAAQDLWSLILSGPRDYHLHFVESRPEPAQLLSAIGHGLHVFLKVYSTNKATDLEALAVKIETMQTAIPDNLRFIEQ